MLARAIPCSRKALYFRGLCMCKKFESVKIRLSAQSRIFQPRTITITIPLFLPSQTFFFSILLSAQLGINIDFFKFTASRARKMVGFVWDVVRLFLLCSAGLPVLNILSGRDVWRLPCKQSQRTSMHACSCGAGMTRNRNLIYT